MARPGRRYNSYKGRRSKGKTALAALLVLVILAAVVVILMQRHIVYDENGAPRLENPWGETASEEEARPELDLVIQPPETVVEEIQGVRLPAGLLSRENYERVLSAETSVTAVTVVLKDETGTVWFDAAAASSEVMETAEDTAAVLEELTGGELHAIAEINCFHDPKAANADVDEMGLKDRDGHMFYDGENHSWLDPAKPAARQYLCALVAEAAELGFDEVLLTDVSYPVDGKLDQIAYGETAKSENLKLFLEEVRVALEPYETVLTVEVTPDAAASGTDEISGQKLTEIAAVADRVCSVDRTSPI